MNKVSFNASLYHGGNILSYGCNNGIIDFSANINPAGLCKNAVKILKDFKKIRFFTENYPETYPKSFIKTLSDYHNIDKKFIHTGAGATDLIFNITDIFKPATVVIVEPSFAEYERAALVSQSKIIHINTHHSEGFELKEKSLSSLLECINKIGENDLVFISNPSNPAGTITFKNTLTEILNRLKKRGAFLVLDESFMDFCEEFSAKHMTKYYDNLIVIRSLTKFFAMPGQRLGYIIADRRIIKKLTETTAPWKATSLGTEIASASLIDAEYILNTVKLIDKLKKDLRAKIERLKTFQIIPGMANFFLLKIINTGEFNALDLKNYLIKSRILIRYCGNYRSLNDKYFRIAIRKKSENNYLIKKLKEFIS